MNHPTRSARAGTYRLDTPAVPHGWFWLLLAGLLCAGVHADLRAAEPAARGPSVSFYDAAGDKSEPPIPATDEAARWTLPKDATWTATAGAAPEGEGVALTLPRRQGTALERRLGTGASAASADFDASAYASAQLEFTLPAPCALTLEITDAAGKRWSETKTLRAGRQPLQAKLADAAAAGVDLKHLARLALGLADDPAVPTAPTETVVLRQLRFGPVQNVAAEEIENSWLYAFLSHWGYVAFFAVLIMISMGIPLPEEIFLLTAGYLAHETVKNPAIGINVHIVTVVCMAGILGGDMMVYSLGRFRGEKVRQWRLFKWLLPDKAFVRVRAWFDKRGVMATAAFRFIPPIRMPGFFAAGLLKQPPLTFLVTDGIACLISIPTQIYLVYFFGDYVIPYVKKFNLVLIVAIVVFVIGYAIWEVVVRKKEAGDAGSAEANAQSATGIAALDGADAAHIHTKHSDSKGSEGGTEPAAPPEQN